MLFELQKIIYWHTLHMQFINTGKTKIYKNTLNLPLCFKCWFKGRFNSLQSLSHQYSDVSMCDGTLMWKISGGVWGALLTPESLSGLDCFSSPSVYFASNLWRGSDAGGGGVSALGLMFLKCCRRTTSLFSAVHGNSTEMSLRNLELMPK